MDPTRTFLVALFAAVVLSAAPAAAFSQAFFHTQSNGNRGTDVVAIQYLLNHRGYTVAVDGIFGSQTDTAVRSFQAASGLAVDGIVGPQTWSSLVATVRRGDSNDAVRAVQNSLNEKMNAGLVVDGIFGSLTESAVRSFQTHAGITSDGIVGPTTWKNLVWHYELRARSASLCGYSGDSTSWGTGAAIGQLEAAASSFYATGNGGLALGDVSLEHGGDIAGHVSHEVGLDADIRPVRLDSAQCTAGCRWDQSCYDRDGTRELVNALRAKAPGHIRLILFNDPVLIQEGLTTYYENHDNHLHIRYCEKVHSDSRYVC